MITDEITSDCYLCGEPFTPEEWEDRHTDPDSGEDCHERCCPLCNRKYKRALKKITSIGDGNPNRAMVRAFQSEAIRIAEDALEAGV